MGQMTLAQVEALLAEVYPVALDDFSLQSLTHADLERGQMGRAVITLDPEGRHLRPGGTVSGPTIFAMLDVAAYVCVLGHIGPAAMTVTTNASVDFMRKPEARLLQCRMTLLKLGRSLAVMEGRIFHPDAPRAPLVRANLTYAVPRGAESGVK